MRVPGGERERRLVGVMSGTSCDGVDAVAVAITGDERPTVRVAHHEHAGYDDDLRARLLALGEARVDEIALLHVELGRCFGAAARAAIDAAGWTSPGGARPVDAVAVAGHTAVHLPPGPDGPGATLALGDGDVVAELCSAPVLSEFRARDRAAGGHGAPLVPWADACLLRRPDRVTAALNLGGIANLTVVPPVGDPVAFDTGPGNMLIDGALSRKSEGRRTFDKGGALGLAGRIDEAWLCEALAGDAFLGQPPPRSTGRERYGAVFLQRHWDHLGRLSEPDLAATLAAYSVEAVARALEEHVADRPAELVVSGGGAYNRCLMEGLSRRLAPMAIRDSEGALGIPVFAREAVSFALLGDATLRGLPGNVPSVTGAARPVVLGKLSFGPQGSHPFAR